MENIRKECVDDKEETLEKMTGKKESYGGRAHNGKVPKNKKEKNIKITTGLIIVLFIVESS